jgi:hypothetical protein
MDDRILQPLIRTGQRGSGSFREATWVELDAEGVALGGPAKVLTSTDVTVPGVARIRHGDPFR